MVTFDLLVSLSKNLISGGLSAAAFQFTTAWQKADPRRFPTVSPFYSAHVQKKKKEPGIFPRY